jgi:hypothetical protein
MSEHFGITYVPRHEAPEDLDEIAADHSARNGFLARTFLMAVVAVVAAFWNLGILAMGTAFSVYLRAAKMHIEESPNRHVQLHCVEVGDVLTGPLSEKVKGLQDIVVKTWLYRV